MLDLDDPPLVPTRPRSPFIFIGRCFVRLIVRRVNEKALALDVCRESLASEEWVVRCIHGGSVANAYRSPADTEAALALASPAGLVIVWMARLPANKVTLSGCAQKCLKGTRALFDPRFGDTSKEDAWNLLKAAHRAHFPLTAHERLLGDDSL
jgi:hypothetical protein